MLMVIENVYEYGRLIFVLAVGERLIKVISLGCISWSKLTKFIAGLLLCGKGRENCSGGWKGSILIHAAA